MEQESKIHSQRALKPFIISFFILTLGIFLYIILANLGIGRFISLASDFINPDISKLESIDGNINFLILGKSGEGHDGADLTDSMMYVSLSTDKDKIDTISLPRDIWIPSIRAKLNSAYYWGNQMKDTNGLTFSKEIASNLIGQQINYGVVIDFSGFVEVVDVIGGVNVNVEKAFTDNKYPIAGKENDLCGGDKEYKCRYETITFEKGVQEMNGERALKFVRSRNSEGDEGTDLARSARQQKVINAIKDKMLTPGVILNPLKVYNSWKVAEKYVETDIDFSALGTLARYAFDARGNINQHSIPEDYLENPPISKKYDNLYVFIPASGTWEELQSWISSILGK